MASPARFLALLRGINVGGRNKVPMQILRELFEGAGATEVSTYIQSGNVLFTAAGTRAATAVAERARAALEAELGVDSPMIVRSAKRMREVAAAHPLAKAGDLDKLLMVAFLSRKPKVAGVRALDPERCAPDSFEVRGSEVYLRYAKGAGRSKLTTTYLDRTLDAVSTVRNWRTVNALVERVG